MHVQDAGVDCGMNGTYRFGEVKPGRLRYDTEPSHPLRGGVRWRFWFAGRQPAALVRRLRCVVAATGTVCCGVYAAVFREEVLCGAGEQFVRAVGGYHNESLRDGSQWLTTNGEAEGGRYFGGALTIPAPLNILSLCSWKKRKESTEMQTGGDPQIRLRMPTILCTRTTRHWLAIPKPVSPLSPTLLTTNPPASFDAQFFNLLWR